MWRDRWLPTPTTYKVMSPRNLLHDEAMVCDLIDLDTKRWNGALIDQTFMEDEASIIKSIPISPGGGPNSLIWNATPNGQITVKSAYGLAVTRCRDAGACAGEASDSSSEEVVWKTLWKLDVPPKIKMFGWKVCCNILPTKCNLRSRGLDIEAVCPVCRKENETMLHCLRDCKPSKKFWKLCHSELGVLCTDFLLDFRDALCGGQAQALLS